MASGFDSDWLNRHLIRHAAVAHSSAAPVAVESELHREIMAWCDAHRPWPWVHYHARMDRKSTLENGAADFVLFGPFPLCIVIECKARNEKQREDQLIWAARMARIGWTVHVVRSMVEFLALVTEHHQRRD